MSIKKGIRRAVARDAARFFMPGHKGTLHPFDVTELPGTDNLHQPEGIIKEAQERVASMVGAEHTFFSVGGSSAGLHSLILSVCNRGDSLVVDRGCHISAIHIMTLFDITPIFVYPRQSRLFGVSCGIEADAVACALQAHPEAKGVLVTSPTYYGVCSNLREIAKTVHAKGLPLLVDEAHGAHFPFHPSLPATALQCGADGVVQSAHKTLPCLTQGAVVHLASRRISHRRVGEIMTMLQTTSPSYLLLSSIERSFDRMQREGEPKLDLLLSRLGRLRSLLDQSKRLFCMNRENCGGHDFDPTRIVIRVAGGTGNIAQTLQSRYRVIMEMDDGYQLIGIPTICNRERDFSRLAHGLRSILKSLPPASLEEIPRLPVAKKAMPLSEAFFSPTKLVSPQQAIGKIAARSVYKTPPCMPILCPGELVTEEIAAQLSEKITIVQ
jgi:lysine decarboxylase